MARAVKVRKIGNEQGVTLSDEALARLGVGVGDTLYVVDTPDGLQLSRFDPDFEQALEASRSFMRRYPNAMKTLAKGE